MRIFILTLIAFAISIIQPAQAQIAQEKELAVTSDAQPLVEAARDRLKAQVIYDPSYVRLDYPNGDVSPTTGVCTDVLIRSYRAAFGFDLQKAVHEDMKSDFDAYPDHWGHTGTDKNIDHRRVPNLEAWFTRAGHAQAITYDTNDYKPGDIVSWRLDGRSGSGGVPHIGIVSDRVSRLGRPMIIHYVGSGPNEDDMIFDHTIMGHFRFFPPSD